MDSLRFTHALALVAAYCAFAFSATSAAEPEAIAAPPDHFAWDRDPSNVVVSYREVWGEFAQQDPTPLLRVFGDGRVLVHHPSYTRMAGDYVVWLQEAELESLLSSLLANGLATFEPGAVKSLKQAKEQGRLEKAAAAKQSTEIFVVADKPLSVFELNLTAVGSGQLQRKISWSGLDSDVRQYPDIEPIQKLRAAEQMLRGLVARDDLSKIR